MKKTLCHELNLAGFGITLCQTGIDRFVVRYGKELQEGLTYAEAARAYGEAIMHALACEGRLDNRMKGERL